MKYPKSCSFVRFHSLTNELEMEIARSLDNCRHLSKSQSSISIFQRLRSLLRARAYHFRSFFFFFSHCCVGEETIISMNMVFMVIIQICKCRNFFEMKLFFSCSFFLSWRSSEIKVIIINRLVFPHWHTIQFILSTRRTRTSSSNQSDLQC